jgi:hypothetical protein
MGDQETGVIALLVKEVNLLRALVKAQGDLLYYRKMGLQDEASRAKNEIDEIRRRLEAVYSQ